MRTEDVALLWQQRLKQRLQVLANARAKSTKSDASKSGVAQGVEQHCAVGQEGRQHTAWSMSFSTSRPAAAWGSSAEEASIDSRLFTSPPELLPLCGGRPLASAKPGQMSTYRQGVCSSGSTAAEAAGAARHSPR